MSGLVGMAKWLAVFEAFKLGKEAIGAEFDVGQTLTNLQMQGFSSAQVQQAYEAAVSTQQSVGGSTVPGNLSLVGMLMAILQRPGQSINALPEFARFGQVLGAFNHGDAGTELFAAMRGGEFRGVLSAPGSDDIDASRLAKFLKELAATDIISHGSIGPNEILQMLRGGGISGATIDDESLFADQMSLRMALGAQAGTALQGFGQQFSGGKMSQAAANLLAAMGLIKDPRKVVSFGIGQEMFLPGSMAQGDLDLATDKPAEFVEKVLLPRMKAFLSGTTGVNMDTVGLFGGKRMQAEFRSAIKHMETEGYATATPERQQQMELRLAQTLASRITGGKEIAEIIRNFPLITRDREAWLKQMNGPDPYQVLEGTSPLQAQKAAGAAWGAMGIAWARLAEPGIVAGLQGATAFANALAGAANYLKGSSGDGTTGTYGEVLAHPLSSNLMMSPLQAWVMQKLDAWLGKGPIPVTVTNGRDLADGVTRHQERMLDQPQSTSGGWDVHATPYGTGGGP